MAAAISGNGFPMELVLGTSITGTGPMAQASNVQFVTKLTAISHDKVADNFFVVPTGYTKK